MLCGLQAATYDLNFLVDHLFVSEKESSDIRPEIGVVVEVGHGLVERALQDVPMVLEQPQHNAPHRCSEPGKYGEL